MNRVWMAFLASAITAPAFGQGSDVLYTPTRTIKDQNITVHSWGSGTVSETDETSYEGTHSIRISTRNLFQGGALVFNTPTNLARSYEDKFNQLKLTFRGTESTASNGFGGTGRGVPGGVGTRGNVGRGGPGGLSGGGGTGARGTGGGIGQGIPGGVGIPGGGFPGAGGLRGTGTRNAAAADTGLKQIRLIISTTDGLKSEAYIPVTTSRSSDRGWTNVSIPLQAISGFDRTNKIVNEVTVTGDGTATFYVGDLRVVNDSTPITGEPSVRTMNLAIGDEVELSATGQGGSSILKYSWDFDDKDGIQADAVGQAIRRHFRVAGTFTVTLTITDVYGLKKPYVTTIKTVVNP